MKEIKLTQGKVAFVDDEDFDRVNQFKWYAGYSRGKWYARRTVNVSSTIKKAVVMHRFILGLSDVSIEVDHIDHNGLNNQRSNLRKCTQAENKRNKSRAKNSSSIYLGVGYKKKRGKKWMANIRRNGKNWFLGYFLEEKDAAIAYDNAAKSLFGDFANVNFK